MNRTDKGFILVIVVVLFVVMGFIFPWYVGVPFLAFIFGLLVGGGIDRLRSVLAWLFKQFRNPEKTHTPSPNKARRKAVQQKTNGKKASKAGGAKAKRLLEPARS